MKNRRLKKKEVMIISKILEDVNFKYYMEYLLSNKVDKILKSGQNKNDKIVMIMGDIMAFILQNVHKAEENIDSLIMSYSQINQEAVDNLSVDDYLETLKVVFMAGVPSVISDYIDITEVKKKFEELKETSK